jgi:hypothetical protein
MTKQTKFLILLFSCILFGALFYAWHAKWIIITFPTSSKNHQEVDSCIKKNVQLYHWFAHKWVQESTEILWTSQEAINAQQLIQVLLELLAEDYAIKKKSSVSHVIRTYNNQQLIIFLDQAPFTKNISIHTKLMIIESMLKTLRENGITTPFITFFVGQQPLQDQHLDFTIAWPLQGFLGT